MKIDSEEKKIKDTVKFVKSYLKNAEGGHDWFHVERVYKNALVIAKGEKVNLLVVKLAALLHDIGDYKFTAGNDCERLLPVVDFLKNLNLDQEDEEHILKIVQNVSFKGGNVRPTHRSRELEIVQDADRLDALGAIGIARAFNYGGFKNRKLYDPDIDPKLNLSFEEYKNAASPTINHFYEKLLLLKDKMHTTTAKRIAEERHLFLQAFLDRFYKEWEGEQ